jgi:hypothetical protein
LAAASPSSPTSVPVASSVYPCDSISRTTAIE